MGAPPTAEGDEPATLGGSSRAPTRTVAFLPGGDRFEDWFDKVGISFDTFRDRLTGGWLFNYVQALRLVDVRTILVFGSDRVVRPVRFTHAPTHTPVVVLPTAWLGRKVAAAEARYRRDRHHSASFGSYLSTPALGLAREFRRERCDAVLCQEYEHPRFDACVAIGRVLRVPVFATYQGADQTPEGWERRVRTAAIRRSAGLIVGAGTEIRRVRRTYGVDEARISHVPNPMDVRRWRPGDRAEARRAVGIDPSARVVAWHGHAQLRRKGLDVLLEAWARSRPAGGDDALLLLVGTTRNTDDLRRRVAASTGVRWIDRYVLDRDELWRYLSAADVYCLSSRHEGFAVAPIEAMSCGLPVVATDVSGVRDLLGDGEDGGGVIVPPEDPAALAAALARLLDEPRVSAELGRRARVRAEREFSLEIVGPKLRDALFGDR
jgi:glycosyltransferase involved in cell wall biosynthesis